ncbi:MAG: hypothetical protein WCL32_14380 [Planctomycetota bacterium]
MREPEEEIGKWDSRRRSGDFLGTAHGLDELDDVDLVAAWGNVAAM